MTVRNLCDSPSLSDEQVELIEVRKSTAKILFQPGLTDDERLEKMVRYIGKLGTKRWRAGVKYGEDKV